MDSTVLLALTPSTKATALAASPPLTPFDEPLDDEPPPPVATLSPLAHAAAEGAPRRLEFAAAAAAAAAGAAPTIRWRAQPAAMPPQSSSEAAGLRRLAELDAASRPWRPPAPRHARQAAPAPFTFPPPAAGSGSSGFATGGSGFAMGGAPAAAPLILSLGAASSSAATGSAAATRSHRPRTHGAAGRRAASRAEHGGVHRVRPTPHFGAEPVLAGAAAGAAAGGASFGADVLRTPPRSRGPLNVSGANILSPAAWREQKQVLSLTGLLQEQKHASRGKKQPSDGLRFNREELFRQRQQAWKRKQARERAQEVFGAWRAVAEEPLAVALR